MGRGRSLVSDGPMSLVSDGRKSVSLVAQSQTGGGLASEITTRCWTRPANCLTTQVLSCPVRTVTCLIPDIVFQTPSDTIQHRLSVKVWRDLVWTDSQTLARLSCLATQARLSCLATLARLSCLATQARWQLKLLFSMQDKFKVSDEVRYQKP